MGFAMPAALVASSLISGLFNKSGRNDMRKLPTMAPYQQRAFQQGVENPIQNTPSYQSGNSFLQRILSSDPEAFKAFEEPLYQNFEQKILPTIGERFAGAGTGAGALNSSAFGGQLAQAGRGLQTDLAALRSGLQMQSLPQALAYAQQPYANNFAQSQIPTFAYQHQQGAGNPFGPLAQGIGQGIGFNAFGQSGGMGGMGGGLQGLFSFLGGGGGIGGAAGKAAPQLGMGPGVGAF